MADLRAAIRTALRERLGVAPDDLVEHVTQAVIASGALGGPPKKLARTTDPETSADAAQRARERLAAPGQNEWTRTSQYAQGVTDFTQEEVADVLRDWHSPTRVRHAVGDLVAAGVLVKTGGKRRTRSGSKADLYRFIRPDEGAGS